jgi:hypothetical protein
MLSPSPSAPPLMAISTTVHCPGEARNRPDPTSTSSIHCTIGYVRANGVSLAF